MKIPRYVVILAVVVVAAGFAAAGYFAWKQYEASKLPPGIVSTNGRVEATQVDISTKVPGARDCDRAPRGRHGFARGGRRPDRHLRNRPAVGPGEGRSSSSPARRSSPVRRTSPATTPNYNSRTRSCDAR